MKTLTAKYPGTCMTCGQSFPKGTLIIWNGRGRASHCSCPSAEPKTEALYLCWECKDPNGRQRNYGAATPVYCDPCEARIRPTTLDYQLRHPKPTQEDYPCSDLGYEDQCAEACGPGL